MKGRFLTSGVVVAVIAAAVVVFALLASARRWDRQKAARLRDFTHTERAVAWQRRAARNDPDESRLTQMERDLQIARLQMIIFYTTKPLPFPYSAKEAAQLARWQQEAAAFQKAHPLPGTTATPTPPFALFKGPLWSKPPGRRLAELRTGSCQETYVLMVSGGRLPLDRCA